MAFPPKRERHQQRNLSQLRRLKIHRPQVKPTSGSIELETDSRDEHEHQQNECEDKQREGDFFEPPIIHHRGGKTGHQTKPAPHQLHAEKARAALRHARAVEHYNPQRQQARYTDGQNVGGVSHDPISRKPKRLGAETHAQSVYLKLQARRGHGFTSTHRQAIFRVHCWPQPGGGR